MFFTNINTDSLTADELKKILGSDPLAIMGAKDGEDGGQNEKYAGFWLRIGSRLIDNIITLSLSGFLVTFFQTIGIYLLKEERWIYVSQCSSSSLNRIPQTGQCRNLIAQVQPFLYVAIILATVLTALYFVILPMTRMRSTLGERVFGLKVYSVDKLPISVLQSIAREIIFILHSIITVSTFFESRMVLLQLVTGILIVSNYLFIIVFSDKMQTLQDNMAQTIVVTQDKSPTQTFE